MSKMRTELQDKARRGAFVESRLEDGMFDLWLASEWLGAEYCASLRQALRELYLEQIDDGLNHHNSWIDGDAASFERALEGIENHLNTYANGYEAGYKAALEVTNHAVRGT